MPGCPRSLTSRAASAVELAASVVAPGSSRARNRRTWAVAWGIETTVVTSASTEPLGTSKLSWTWTTTSRWIRRSVSNAKVSRVTLTVPSIEFSMGTKPRAMPPSTVAESTSEIEAMGSSSPPARSAWDNRACSVKVP